MPSYVRNSSSLLKEWKNFLVENRKTAHEMQMEFETAKHDQHDAVYINEDAFYVGEVEFAPAKYLVQYNYGDPADVPDASVLANLKNTLKQNKLQKPLEEILDDEDNQGIKISDLEAMKQEFFDAEDHGEVYSITKDDLANLGVFKMERTFKAKYVNSLEEAVVWVKECLAKPYAEWDKEYNLPPEI